MLDWLRINKCGVLSTNLFYKKNVTNHPYQSISIIIKELNYGHSNMSESLSIKHAGVGLEIKRVFALIMYFKRRLIK